jgi:tetratricopeptide (TPR) repeat protein
MKYTNSNFFRQTIIKANLVVWIKSKVRFHKPLFIASSLITLMWLTFSSCTHKKGVENTNPTFEQDTTLINQELSQYLARHSLSFDEQKNKLISIIQQAEKSNYINGLATSYLELGNTFYDNNKYDEAGHAYQKGFELIRDSGNELLKARLLERMASLHLSTDNPYLAYSYYYQSLFLFEKVKNPEGIARVYNAIGIAYTGKDPEKAEHYLKKALVINTRLKNMSGIINNKGNLGYLFEVTGRWGEAEEMYNSLVSQLLEMNDSLNLPVIYFNISSLHQRKEDYAKGLKYIFHAAHISEAKNDSALLSTLYGNAGEIYLKFDKYDSALYYLKKSIRCSKMTGDIETELQALELLFSVDTTRNDIKNTIIHSKEIICLKDSISSIKLKNTLESSEQHYNNSRIEFEKNIDNIEAERKIARKELWVTLLFFTSLSTLLLTLLLISQKRNLKRNLKIKEQEIMLKDFENEKIQNQLALNKLIIEKNKFEKQLSDKKLLNLSLNLEEKNELIKEVLNKMKNNPQKDGASVTLEEVFSDLKSKTSLSESFSEFNTRLSEVHPEFISALKNNNPGLTKSEIKFCCFIKVHLTNKQIAQLLNVSFEAIRKTRYRIRKKIGLMPSQSLEEYIENL